MDQLKTELGRRLNQRSLARTATAAHICHVANAVSHGDYTAVSYRDGTLTLAAPSPGAAQNLKLRQIALTEELQAATKQPLRLRIIVRT